MAEQVGRDDAIPRERPLGKLLRMPPVPGDPVEIHGAGRIRITPRLDVECAAHELWASASSDSGTISVRRSSFTSDQITRPSLSIRNVPRRGAPVASSKTP